MRRSREDLREAIFAGQREVDKLIERTEENKRRLQEKVQAKADEIIAEIKALQAEQQKVMAAPMMREQLLKRAKERFGAQKKRTIREGLVRHFRGCQTGIIEPFDPDEIRHAFSSHEGGHHQLFLEFFVIHEDDIEAAIAELPEGITEEEREKKIAQIDKKVAQLREQLEKGT